MLKYQTWYRHRVKEDNLQAMLVIQARLRSDIDNDINISHNHGQDEPDLSAHRPVQPDEQIDEELHDAQSENGLSYREKYSSESNLIVSQRVWTRDYYV
jgi:hypothetical protein